MPGAGAPDRRSIFPAGDFDRIGLFHDVRIADEAAEASVRTGVDDDRTGRTRITEPDRQTLPAPEHGSRQRGGGEGVGQQPSGDRIGIVADDRLRGQLPETADGKADGLFFHNRIAQVILRDMFHFLLLLHRFS